MVNLSHQLLFQGRYITCMLFGGKSITFSAQSGIVDPVSPRCNTLFCQNRQRLDVYKRQSLYFSISILLYFSFSIRLHSALDGTGRHSFYNLFLEHGVTDDDRNHHDHNRSRNQPVIGRILRPHIITDLV